MQDDAVATFTTGSSPLLVTAIHAGSAMRCALQALCGLDRHERLREEDPFTDLWTTISDNRIVGLRSRFEMDLNRSRDKAIYRVPADCWGLNVWKDTLPREELALSLAHYDAFYATVDTVVGQLLARHGRVVIYDLHSYNHQREGPGIDDDPERAPEINLGTVNMDRSEWGPVVEALSNALRTGAGGRTYDVRENVKFKGGHFSHWLHQRFGAAVCPVAIEFKKVFMNEWTGEPDRAAIARIHALLKASAVPVLQATKASEHA